MFTLADRVKETTTTTGTGTLNLAGAETGFRTFVSGAGNAAVVYYTIVGQAGGAAAGEWEVGFGTVTDAAPDTLSRTTILSSSNAGAAVDFSAGTKDVFLTAPTASLGFSGALVTLSADVTTNTGAELSVPWNTETYDVGGWHDNGTNPARFTVPAGVDRVIIKVGILWELHATGTRRVFLTKGGVYSPFAGGFDAILKATNVYPESQYVSSGVLEVAVGNYFAVTVLQNCTADLDVMKNHSWFSIEKVGP